MKAGKELDATVAVRVMGWKHEPAAFPWIAGRPIGETGARGYEWLQEFPPYSTDMNLAMQIVDKLDGVWNFYSMPESWRARVSVRQGPFSDKIVSAEAPTLAETICLAGLKAGEQL